MLQRMTSIYWEKLVKGGVTDTKQSSSHVQRHVGLASAAVCQVNSYKTAVDTDSDKLSQAV